MISKVFQAGRRRQCVLPPEFFGPTKSHFQIISSHRHLHLTYHHILLPSKTDISLTAYHEHFPRSDCTNILVEIWGEYFSGILSRAIVRNQPNVARHNNRECISLRYGRVFLWIIRRVFLWNMGRVFRWIIRRVFLWNMGRVFLWHFIPRDCPEPTSVDASGQPPLCCQTQRFSAMSSTSSSSSLSLSCWCWGWWPPPRPWHWPRRDLVLQCFFSAAEEVP